MSQNIHSQRLVVTKCWVARNRSCSL